MNEDREESSLSMTAIELENAPEGEDCPNCDEMYCDGSCNEDGEG